MNADFLYFFCSSSARFLCGNDTAALRVVFVWGGSSCSCSRKENPSCVAFLVFPCCPLGCASTLGCSGELPLHCFVSSSVLLM